MTAAEVNRRWVDALNRHDAAAVAALYAPEAVIRDPQYPQPLEGRDAVLKDTADFLRAFPDLEFSVRSNIDAGRLYATEGSFRGTHQGPLVTPDGEIPPTGRRIEIDAAGFIQLDDEGRILEERRYYDQAAIFNQLGLAE